MDTTLFQKISLDLKHFNQPPCSVVEADTLRGWTVTLLDDGKEFEYNEFSQFSDATLYSCREGDAFAILQSKGVIDASNRVINCPVIPEMLKPGWIVFQLRITNKKEGKSIRCPAFRVYCGSAVDQVPEEMGKTVLDQIEAQIKRYAGEVKIAEDQARECMTQACLCASKAKETEAKTAQVGAQIDNLENYVATEKTAIEGMKSVAQAAVRETQAQANVAIRQAANAKSSENKAKASSDQAKASAAQVQQDLAAVTAAKQATETAKENALTAQQKAETARQKAEEAAVTAQAQSNVPAIAQNLTETTPGKTLDATMGKKLNDEKLSKADWATEKATLEQKIKDGGGNQEAYTAAEVNTLWGN